MSATTVTAAGVDPAPGQGEVHPPGEVIMRARGLEMSFGQTHALRGVDLTVDVVRLPPVMPLHKQFVFDGRWPTHHSQVGPWNTPHAAGMPLINGGFSKVGAVRPFFFHSVSPTRLVKYQRAGVSTHA